LEFASEYAGLALFALLGTGFVAGVLVLQRLLGPRLQFKSKLEPFECGEHQLVSPGQRLNVKFYMVAISFIIFDVEVVFLYPWAVVFSDLGWFGFFAILPFLALLAVGLAYEWLRGGLEWE
jgi:NADH-quinone oxidoreductase subunit A